VKLPGQAVLITPARARFLLELLPGAAPSRPVAESNPRTAWLMTQVKAAEVWGILVRRIVTGGAFWIREFRGCQMPPPVG